MKITERKGVSVLGVVTNYIEILSTTPTKNWVIFLHGAGEVGPADGSNLQEVLKHGWPKHARNGFDFPFNIICPQAVVNHTTIVKVLPAWLRIKYDAIVFQTGLSMGGYGTYDALLYDDLKLICAAAPVCGAGRLNLIDNYKHHPPIWHFHGALDPTVKLNTAKGFIDKYNSLYDPDIKLTVYPEVLHNAWDKAYSVTEGEDELLQWTMIQFANAPKENIDEIKTSVNIFLQSYQRSVNDMFTAVNQLAKSIDGD